MNILPGDGSTGAALVRHPDIDKIAFTGSTGVGKDIQAATAGRDIGLTLELGGKSANIVFDDAAIDQAVEGIVNGIFFNQGHVCCAGSRLLIQESVAEEVIEKLWRRMGLLRVGDPLDKNTDVGAINSAEQLQRIEALVDAGEREGATRRTVACALPERGYWFPPTLFTDVAPAHRIAVEEIFGPVVSVMTFRTQAEAIEKANATAYGLAAGVWTDKGSRALAVARGLKAGVVWQNTYNQFDPTSPFGGYKESGFGREGGAAGLRPYVRMRDGRAPARRQDLQALRGRRVRAQRVGPSLTPTTTRTTASPTRRAARARTCATPSGRARRAAGLAGPHGLQPRPDPLPLRRGARVAHRRADQRDRAPARDRARRRARRDRGGGRPRRPLRGLDRQAARRARRGQPGRGAALQLHVPGADRRRRRDRARGARRARPRRRDPAAARGRQRGRGRRVRALAAAAAAPRRDPRRGRRARRRGQPAVRPALRAGQAAGRPPRRRRHPRRHRRSRGHPPGRRQRHARGARPATTTSTWQGSTASRGSSPSSSSRPPGIRSAPDG